MPGHFAPQPVYAPALVAFIGDPGVGFAVAGAGPAVGWFPLGPNEVYWPAVSFNGSGTTVPWFVDPVGTATISGTASAPDALVSNFFLGQGPWTPWQMLAWGGCGVVEDGRPESPLRVTGEEFEFAAGERIRLSAISGAASPLDVL